MSLVRAVDVDNVASEVIHSLKESQHMLAVYGLLRQQNFVEWNWLCLLNRTPREEDLTKVSYIRCKLLSLI